MKSYKGREANHAAYEKLKAAIAKKYPQGHLVAINGGRIVANAAEFDALTNTLRKLGFNPRESLIVEAGSTLPDRIDIFI